MGSKSDGNMMWDAVVTLLTAAIRFVFLLGAWILKLTGSVILYISSLIFKYAGK
jgi:hypothetical protein